MKYVGFAALGATFWLLVATIHFLVHGECEYPPEAAEMNVPAPDPAPVVAPPVALKVLTRPNLSLPGIGAADRTPAGMDHFLSKAAVVAGMSAVKPLIHECYVQYQVPGMALVSVIIGQSGRVSSATTTGRFAGTPTGACVERAVRTAYFPPSDGLATPYPFFLR